MPNFSKKVAEIASESLFTKTELEKLFKTNKERDEFLQVRTIIRE